MHAAFAQLTAHRFGDEEAIVELFQEAGWELGEHGSTRRRKLVREILALGHDKTRGMASASLQGQISMVGFYRLMGQPAMPLNMEVLDATGGVSSRVCRAAGLTPCPVSPEELGVLGDPRGASDRVADYPPDPAPELRAAWTGDLDALRHLHDEKAVDLDVPDAAGVTALLIAADHGHTRLVKYLLRQGADPRRQFEEHTAAELAADAAEQEAERRGDGTESLSDVARRQGHEKTIRLLDIVEASGGWREYTAGLRLPYARIRHKVGKTYAVLDEGHEDRELLHFVFGKNGVVGEEPTSMHTAPAEIFGSIIQWLVD